MMTGWGAWVKHSLNDAHHFLKLNDLCSVMVWNSGWVFSLNMHVLLPDQHGIFSELLTVLHFMLFFLPLRCGKSLYQPRFLFSLGNYGMDNTNWWKNLAIWDLSMALKCGCCRYGNNKSLSHVFFESSLASWVWSYFA